MTQSTIAIELDLDWFIDNCGNNVSKSDYTEGFDANGNTARASKNDHISERWISDVIRATV